MEKKSTGERLEFYGYSDVTIEHLHRYAIANDFVKDKVVLDIASGEGYGSYILSKNASKVIGVDIDKEAVIEAQKKYLNDNLNFTVGSADNIPLDSNTIDVVVSFETIEHHDKHDEMLIEIKRVLKHDGILIMSSPDKEYYSDKIGQLNKFHVKELYFKEFKFLINKYFKFSTFYFQKSYNYNSFISCDESYKDVEIYSGDNMLIQKGKIVPLYNLVLASDFSNYSLKTSIFEGSKIKNLELNKLIEQKCYKIYDTTTFKVGKFLCYPFFKLKSIICKKV